MHNNIWRLAPPFLAVAMATAGASAADLGPYDGRQTWRAPGASYYAPEFRWSGFYAGLQAGYAWGDTSASLTTLAPFAVEGYGYSTSGAIGGVHAGFNWQSSNVVFGVETDLELSGIEGSGRGTLGGGHATSIDWMGSLRGRAGITMGRTLFYLTGGLAYGDVSVERTSGAVATALMADSAWKTGWTLGGGIEHAFTPNMTARIEYRYTDLGNVSFTSFAGGASESTDVTHGAVRAGLSFKF
jgi:outer membrane immunogenic protein